MRSRPLFALLLAAILLPVAVYLRVWDYYAVNIPKWDDHSLKAFLLEYAGAETFLNKWAALSRQHNEHRILLTRLVTWWDYAWFGQLNYKHLMLAGNLLLLGVVVLWWHLLDRNRKPLFALLPIAFIWPTLAHWENMYWGMAAVQNFGVVTLVLLSLYWSMKGGWAFFAAGLFTGGLAAFSSGNGLLIFPILLLLLLLNRKIRQSIIAGVISAVYIFLYFNAFIKVDYNPPAKASVGLLVKGYMAFLGSFAEVFPVKGTQDTCIIFGTVLFLVSVSIVYRTVFRLLRGKYDSDSERITDSFCLGAMLFILGTTAIVIWGRAGNGVDTLLTSRYKIYSFLLLITAYLFIVIPIRGSFFRPYVTGVTFLSVLFNVFAYHYYLVDAYNLRRDLTTSHFNQIYKTLDLDPFTDTSAAHGLVEKPALFYEKWLPLLQNLQTGKVSGNSSGLHELMRTTSVRTEANQLYIENASYRSQRLQDSGVYLLLRSPERYYLLPTHRSRNTGRKQLFLKQQYFSPGYHAEIAFSEMDPGYYNYGLVLQKGDSTGILMGKDSVYIAADTLSRPVRTNW